MGSEDLFHRRKAKTKADLVRTNKQRQRMKKILIVCEGEKTEPEYFNDLIQFHRLTTASIKVTGDCGSSPTSVVNYAKELFKIEQEKNEPYDYVYCVFDKDSHVDYQAALSQLGSLNPKGVFVTINSVPCFEYWLLLHFTYSRKAFANTKRKSCGAQMLEELKKFFPTYEKKKAGVFTALNKKLPDALRNCERANKSAADEGSDNPTSKVDSLVKALIKIRDDFDQK